MTKAQAEAYIRAIEKAAKIFDRSTKQIEDAFATALQRAQRSLAQSVDAWVSDMPSMNNTTLQQRLTWHAVESKRLSALVRASGYYDATNKYVQAMDEVAELARKIMTGGGVDAAWGAAPERFVDAVKARDFAHFDYIGREAVSKLDDIFMDAVVGGVSRATALADLRSLITGEYEWGDRMGLYEWHAGTYARTALHRHAQLFLNAEAKEAGLHSYLYVGTVDGKLREFCAGIVGGVFTEEEIGDMDNGQTGDVMTDCGGFNCRHQWVGVTDELADQIKADAGLTEELQASGEATGAEM